MAARERGEGKSSCRSSKVKHLQEQRVVLSLYVAEKPMTDKGKNLVETLTFSLLRSPWTWWDRQKRPQFPCPLLLGKAAWLSILHRGCDRGRRSSNLESSNSCGLSQLPASPLPRRQCLKKDIAFRKTPGVSPAVCLCSCAGAWVWLQPRVPAGPRGRAKGYPASQSWDMSQTERWCRSCSKEFGL